VEIFLRYIGSAPCMKTYRALGQKRHGNNGMEFKEMC